MTGASGVGCNDLPGGGDLARSPGPASQFHSLGLSIRWEAHGDERAPIGRFVAVCAPVGPLGLLLLQKEPYH